MSNNATSPILLKYLSAFEKRPTSRVFAPLAESYRKLGMYDEALKVLKDGIRNHPTYVLGYIGLAQVYFDQEKFEEAYMAIRPLISSNQDNILLQKVFGNTCLELGNLEEALETFKYLLFLNPKDSDIAQKVEVLETDIANNLTVTEEEEILTDKKSFFSHEEDNWVRLDLNQSVKEVEEENIPEGEWSVTKLAEHAAKTYQDTVSGRENRALLEEASEELNKKFSEEIQLVNEERAHKPVKNVPMMTHTLADIYASQGLYDQAISVLDKMLENNPGDERTIGKLDEIKGQMYQNSSEETVESSQDNENDLMKFYDEKVGKKNHKLEKIENLYQLFLEEIRSKITT